MCPNKSPNNRPQSLSNNNNINIEEERDNNTYLNNEYNLDYNSSAKSSRNITPKLTKKSLLYWLNNNTRVRHQTIIKSMSTDMKHWLSTESVENIDAVTEQCFEALTKIAQDSEHNHQEQAAQTLDKYKDLISTTIIQLRAVAANETCDTDYLTALTQAVLKHAPTNKASFKKWLEKNAERIFNETFPWNIFKRYDPELTQTLNRSLFKLKTNFTQIAEEHAKLEDNSEIDEQTNELDSTPIKQFNAAFRNIPSKTLQKIILNIVYRPQLDKTQLEISIRKILTQDKVNADFLTKNHIGQAWKLKEQVRGLLETEVSVNKHLAVPSSVNIVTTTAKAAVATAAARYGAYYAGYKPESLIANPPVSRMNFFLLHSRLITPQLNSFAKKLPVQLGNLLKDMNAVVAFTNPIPHIFKLTRKIIGTKASAFFMQHNMLMMITPLATFLARSVTPDFLINFFASITPTFVSSGANTISFLTSSTNSFITTINPFLFLPKLASNFFGTAVEVVLDDEHILPLVATVSLLAVIAYRSPELNYLYTKLKNSLLEHTGESEENWNELEDEFALPEEEAILLLSGGYQLDDAIIADSNAQNDDEISLVVKQKAQ